LLDKLKTEIPGIVGISLLYARKLIKRKYKYTDSVAVASSKLDFMGEVSSALMFFNEKYIVDDGGKFPLSDMYIIYQNWCSESGKKPMGRHNFTKDINTNIDGIKKTNRRVEGKVCITLNVFDAPDDIIDEDDTLNVGQEEVEF